MPLVDPTQPLDLYGGLDGTARFVSGGRRRVFFCPFGPYAPPIMATPVEQPADTGDGDDEDAPSDGPLPETLLRTTHTRVIHGDDPGDFYCEHLFFLAQREANRDGSSVQANAHGEKMVGFLHMPWDDHTRLVGSNPVQHTRHHDARTVIGAAFRGFFEQLKGPVSDPIKLMLTGYDEFQSVKNNPTADFVNHRENVVAAMQSGFGAMLLDREGRDLPGRDRDESDGERTVAFRVEDGGATRTIHLHTERFEVTDDTLDATHHDSIQRAMRAFQPHAVIGMGVHGGSEFLAEHRADSGGLDLSGDQPRHRAGAGGDVRLDDNYALARAIYLGGNPPQTF